MDPDDTITQRLAALTPQQRRALAALLRAKSAPSGGLRPRPPGTPVPLTHGQRRLWVLNQLAPESPAYNETNTLRLRTRVDLTALRRAVHEICRRHEALRMSVEVVDGTPFQTIAPSISLDIPLIDLRSLPAEARQPEGQRLAAELSRHPFDLAAGPLIRAAVHRLDTDDHVFVLTMHHLVCDGWSMGIFMVELLTLYGSFVTGAPSPLPELAIQYGDYARWQLDDTSAHAQREQLEYWRERLRDLPGLDLPADRPRPAELTYRGARRPVLIEGERYAALVDLAERQNVTLFVVLVAVFAILLHRYTESEDIAVGAPSAGRTRPELEPLIGFFVNTLVLRLSVPGDATFLDVLDGARRTVIEAHAHQDSPFERIVEELQPVRDTARNPLFQVMFQLFQAPSAPGLQKELLLPFEHVDSGISKFDVSLELIWTDEAIRGHLEYSTDLFDASRIDRLIGHFHQLIDSVTGDPAQRISGLTMLTAAEDRQLEEWNRTATPYPREATILDVFDEQVQHAPDVPAVEFGDRILTYRQLREEARTVAAVLADRGVRPGDLVGLHLERSLRLPSALLGILAAGGAYVPLDPDLPATRIAYLLADSGVRVVVTTTAGAADLARSGSGELTAIPIEDAMAGPRPTELIDVARTATDVAYVMYTSGTTGQPKGVAVSHRNVVRLVKNVHYVDYGPGERVLQFAPVSFDASNFELWGCLLNGSQLVIHPPGVPALEELGGFIRAKGISLLWLTTSLFRQVIDCCPTDLRGVREVVTGGEELPVPVAHAAWRSLPRSRIVNGYGPTECTTFACTYTIGRPDPVEHTVPIGTPIENTTAHVLDRHGNSMPVGVDGELYLGGDGVADGYWERPELTADRFVPDPFRAGGRLYRTGDVARYREDGNLLFGGRRDRQIKLNGHRIELGEVEAAVSAHPDVRAVAVLISGTDEKLLTAVCEVPSDTTLTLARLRQFLSERVPHYMLPSQLDVVDRLPLTANGKVDVDEVGRLRARPADGDGAFVAPAGPIETALGEIWMELLPVEQVGATDNFFDLGGHSLVATRLLSRVRNSFGVQVSMREFFDRPTVRGLGEHLADRLEPARQPIGAG